ncbi:MAG: flagellar biosynthetic protein FliR [Nitrospiraceae bacterium]|nr:MAG: flagellar biosynthetic protein FliR [Nitrospiraceae bacterium]
MDQALIQEIKEFSQYIPNFMFILLRSSILISLLPVIGGKQMPKQFRLGLAVMISILLTPVVQFEIAEHSIPLLVMKEVLIGLALGLTVRFIFMAVNMAGQFISYTMGMSMAQVFNPDMGQSTSIAEVYGIMAMLFFLILDAHHDLIYVFVKSFEMLPGGDVNVQALVPVVLSMMSGLFVLALKICAPVTVGVLISHLMTGFLYKAAPQMNIFFVTMPLNIFLGFLLIILSIPVFEYLMGVKFSDMRSEMVKIVSLARG